MNTSTRRERGREGEVRLRLQRKTVALGMRVDKRMRSDFGGVVWGSALTSAMATAVRPEN